MKKGNKLTKVEITNGYVSAYKADGTTAKLSRSERNVLANYKSKSYVDDIIKAFGNPEILEDGFTVIKNGEVKFTYTKPI